jgi:hypothetical protein
MATIDIGKIKPVFKGTYDNSTAYVLDDIVYYNGSSYVAKTSTTGNLPTVSGIYSLLVLVEFTIAHFRLVVQNKCYELTLEQQHLNLVTLEGASNQCKVSTRLAHTLTLNHLV